MVDNGDKGIMIPEDLSVTELNDYLESHFPEFFSYLKTVIQPKDHCKATPEQLRAAHLSDDASEAINHDLPWALLFKVKQHLEVYTDEPTSDALKVACGHGKPVGEKVLHIGAF